VKNANQTRGSASLSPYSSSVMQDEFNIPMLFEIYPQRWMEFELKKFKGVCDYAIGKYIPPKV
jgi:hypothetical protein